MDALPASLPLWKWTDAEERRWTPLSTLSTWAATTPPLPPPLLRQPTVGGHPNPKLGMAASQLAAKPITATFALLLSGSSSPSFFSSTAAAAASRAASREWAAEVTFASGVPVGDLSITPAAYIDVRTRVAISVTAPAEMLPLATAASSFDGV